MKEKALKKLHLIHGIFFINFSINATENLSSFAYQFKSLQTNKIIIKKSIHKSVPIASINKLFTYFIMKEHFQPNEEILVPNKKLIFYEKESRAELLQNEFYKFSDLIFALLIPSGNDVARVLEIKLNEKNLNYLELSKLWLNNHKFYNTNIVEPIGLSFQTQSTVSDLWKLLEKIYSDAQIFKVLKYETYTIYTKSGKPLFLKNKNPLMKYKNYKIFGKTGSTKKAGFCFLGFIQNMIYPEKIYGIIFLGAKDLEKELISFISLLD